MVHAFHMSGDSDNTASNGQLHFAARVMIRYLLIGAWSAPSSEAYLLAPIPHGLAWKSGLWATCDCGKPEKTKTCINMSSLGRQQTKHLHLSLSHQTELITFCPHRRPSTRLCHDFGTLMGLINICWQKQVKTFNV